MITIDRLDRLVPELQSTGQRPACWGVDPEMFFGPGDSSAGSPLHVWERRALAVCADCPVAAACLAEALKFPGADQYGVVGGMSAEQRREVLGASRRKRGRVQRARRGGQNSFPAPGGERRPMRSSGTAAAPAAVGAQRGPWPARP
ncbi:MAG: WhiB family transcriptional regulator [Pseudonocardiaceae bacterium]